MTIQTVNQIDWQQVVTNLEVLSEAQGYSFGLEHDLTVARVELRTRQEAQ